MSVAGARPPQRQIWAGFLGIFVWGSISGLLGALLPALRERAGLSLDESGAMFVALSAGLVGASLTAGVLLDRYGRKRVLVGAVALVVASLVLFEFAVAFPALLVLAFTMGAGGGAVVTGTHALVADLHARHRAAALNLLDVFFGVGAFVTPFVIVPLQRAGGTAAVLFALAGLAAGVLVYLLATPLPPGRSERIGLAEAGAVLRSPRFWAPALLVFLYVGTEQSIWDWQVTYFTTQSPDVDPVTAARLLSVFPVAIMAGRLVNNRLLLRVSPAPVLVASAAGATLCFLVVLLAPGAGGLARPLAAAGLVGAGLCLAAIYPTTLGVVSARFADRSGTALGLAITGGWLGAVAISPSLGFIAQRSDFRTAYALVVGAAAAMAAVAALVAR
ncbi:MAG TPA: MFS transporter, partial [Vicinamibacterales bacterium]|nr:MFS transporter [Vicinamibacterales bacterium]